MKIGEAMYKAQQAGPGGRAARRRPPAAEAGPLRGTDEKVVDAEFEEVDENKKKSA